MKILFIDDNESITNMMKKFFTIKNYECVVSNDGKTGLELIQNLKFDVILLDIAMPSFSGYDVIEYLKNHNLIEKQNIIILTAIIMPQKNIEELLRIGIKSYLEKPISLSQLSNIIQNL